MNTTSMPLPSRPPTPEHAATHLRKQANRVVLAWFAAFMASSIAFWLYQQFDFAGAVALGIPVPDSVNMTRSIDNLLTIGSLNQEGDQFLGVSLLFSWTWALHPALSFLVNAAMMAWVAQLYAKAIVWKLQVPAWSVVGILGNPYLMLAMAGPNKEIPLTLLTILYVRTVTEQRAAWPLVAAALSITTYLFRDGYGAFLFATAALLLGLRSKAKPYVIVMCAGCIAVSTLFGVLADFVPVFSRNVQNFEVVNADNLAVGALSTALALDPFSPVGGFLTFALRLTYNLFSAAFFPVFTTNGGIYWIGIAYWLDGVAALVAIPACVAAVTKLNTPKPLTILGALSLATLFMISVSLFVQPRYLMPVLPLAVAVFASSPRHVRRRSLQFGLGLTLAILVAYRVLDRVPPNVDPESFDPPVYILDF